jgi:phosphoribosyl-AMP cyclohydrolase / phosphoribosyl-ATP pyrophosphohydrolase
MQPAQAPMFDTTTGLVPAIAQHHATGEVLMLAFMNSEAWQRTLATKRAHFYSRSRQSLWQKGETSGHFLEVREIRLDCDQDTVLLRVHPVGPACHTGAPSCFFQVHAAPADADGGPAGSMLDSLYREVIARKLLAHDDPAAARSYTRSLFDAGMPRILAKIAEEHGELAAELPAGPRDRVIAETADLFYHLLVGLAARDVKPADIMAELARRFGTSGITEKAGRDHTGAFKKAPHDG